MHWDVIKKVIGIIILGVSIPFGIYAIAWGVLISGVISTFINAYPNLKLLNYSYIEQWKDIMPSLGISLVMGAVVYTLNFLNIAVWQILMLQVFVGVVIYIGLAKVFKVESFGYLVKTTREIIEGRKKVYA